MAIILQQQGVGERYRDFDMFAPSYWMPVNQWHATHKDYDGDEDDRTLSAKSRDDLIDAIDQWHWEQSVEPLLVALEEIAGAHLGDQPAASSGSDYDWACRHIARLRGIAVKAVTKARQS